jgi:hypothetical protein
LTGLPCCHTIACMKHKNYRIADYVPTILKKEQYAACYSSMIHPVNGQDLWMRTECTDLQPPPVKRQPGRPEKKRRMDASELMRDNSQMKRASYGIKCSRCKQTRHNKSTCPLPPPPPPPPTDQTQSSHPPSSQANTTQPQTHSQSSQPAQPPSSQAHTAQAQTQSQSSQPAQTQSSQPKIQKKIRSPRRRKTMDQAQPSQSHASQPQASQSKAYQAQTTMRSPRKRKNVSDVAATQPTQNKGRKGSRKAGSASQP